MRKFLACHQPNFAPYMGFFYKMYMCDVFTISDICQFSRTEFHNYNFVKGTSPSKIKITIPVCSHSLILNETLLSNFEYCKKKLIKTIMYHYSKFPYFSEVFSLIQDVLEKDYKTLTELNISLIMAFKNYFGIQCLILPESSLNINTGNANKDIVEIAKTLNCDAYISGSGAKKYIDENVFEKNNVKIVWSKYVDKFDNLSVIDYAMKYGRHLPKQWEIDYAERNKF